MWFLLDNGVFPCASSWLVRKAINGKIPDNGKAPTTDVQVLCPVCGATGDPLTSADPAEDFRSSAATLPAKSTAKSGPIRRSRNAFT